MIYFQLDWHKFSKVDKRIFLEFENMEKNQENINEFDAGKTIFLFKQNKIEQNNK